MAGTRAAIQAEILSKIASTDNAGAAEVLGSQSVRELIERDASGNLPAVGVAYRGRVLDGEQPFAVTKGCYITRWEIAVVSANDLGRTSALDDVTAILDTVGARIVNVNSSVTGASRYRLVNEDVDEVDDDKVAGLLAIELPVWMEG